MKLVDTLLCRWYEQMETEEHVVCDCSAFFYIPLSSIYFKMVGLMSTWDWDHLSSGSTHNRINEPEADWTKLTITFSKFKYLPLEKLKKSLYIQLVTKLFFSIIL